MSKLIDLQGQRFGKLEVIEKLEKYNTKNHKGYFWLCKCDCGNTAKVKGENLRNGSTRSCGCFAIETRRSGTHHLSHTRLYNIWAGIKTRCYNKNSKTYQIYGKRGITMCDIWKDDFESFRDWALSNGYSDNLTIERIDYDKGYSPDNCKWIPFVEQSRNRRNNHWIEIDGQTKLLEDWSREYNISPTTILNRLSRNWDVERAIKTPTKKYGNKRQ